MSKVSSMNFNGVAQGLGWFSIGMGLMEILAPKRVAKMLGLNPSSSCGVLRLMGAREIVSGIGILADKKSRRKQWIQSRVAGDAMDLGFLGVALNNTSKPGQTLAATAAVVGVTALDVACSRNLPDRDDGSESQAKESGIHVRKTVTINRPAEELFAFWRELQNLPLFMSHVESVQMTGEKRSHWVVSGPGGKSMEWDADIINEQPNALIAWRSIEGSQVENAGTVRFEPAVGGRGTVVKVELQYSPPAGILGASVAKLFGKSPEQQIDLDLRQFKQLMETGEVTTTVGQPAGRNSSVSKKYDYVTERKLQETVAPSQE